MKINSLIQTGYGCPSQWEGVTDCGLGIYIRYRHGHLSIELQGESVLEKTIANGLHGHMTEAELKPYLKEVGLEY